MFRSSRTILSKSSSVSRRKACHAYLTFATARIFVSIFAEPDDRPSPHSGWLAGRLRHEANQFFGVLTLFFAVDFLYEVVGIDFRYLRLVLRHVPFLRDYWEQRQLFSGWVQFGVTARNQQHT